MSNFLNEIFSDWAVLAGKAQRGEPIKKAEIMRLLDSDAPIPECAKPLIKGMLDKSIKFQRGEVSQFEEVKFSAVWRYYVIKQNIEEDYIKQYLKKELNLKGDPSPRQEALEIISNQFKIDTRTLEKWLKEYKENYSFPNSDKE